MSLSRRTAPLLALPLAPKKVTQTYSDYGRVGRPALPKGALELLPAFPE